MDQSATAEISLTGGNPVYARLLIYVCLAVICIAVFSPTLQKLAETHDFKTHLGFARQIVRGERELLAHPLYHLAVISVRSIGVRWQTAPMIVCLVAIMASASVIFAGYLSRSLPVRASTNALVAAAGLTIILMLVSSISVFTLPHMYIGYILPNVYHSPTMLVMKPFALLLFVYTLGVFSTHQHYYTVHAVVIAAVLSILAALSKPSLTIILLPTLILGMVYAYLRKQPLRWKLAWFGILIPTILILIVQTMLLPNSNSGADKIGIMPFAFIQMYNTSDPLLRFVASIAFPLMVYAVYFHRAIRHFALNFVWLLFAVGAFFTYFVVEVDRVADGNFSWSGQIAVLLLFLVSTQFLLQQIYDSEHHRFKFDFASILCFVVLLLHFGCGLYWWYANSFLDLLAHF